MTGLALRAFGSVTFCLYDFFRIVAGALAFLAVVFNELVFVGQCDACVQQAQCENQQFEKIEGVQGKLDEKCLMCFLMYAQIVFKGNGWCILSQSQISFSAIPSIL